MRHLSFLLMLWAGAALAQGRIDRPASTMGIPMITTETMISMVTPGQGTMVFNTTDHAFYWHDGTTWQLLLNADLDSKDGGFRWHSQRTGKPGEQGVLKISNGTTGFWDLTGNSGTTNTTNFLGTTDAKSFFLRVNNLHAGRIQTTGELSAPVVGGDLIIPQDPGVSSGVGGDLIIEDDPGPSGGDPAPLGNDAGFGHTSLGSEAGRRDGGRHNSFFGRAAGYNVTSGSGNTALGALTMVNGGVSNRNTAVGSLAHGTQSPTSDCTSLGYQAGPQGALTNSTALGSKATVTTSNSLVLGSVNGVNGATTDVNVGIGTTAPARALHISRGSSGGNPNGSSLVVVEDNTNAYINLMTPDANESGVLFGTPTSSAEGAVMYNQSSTPNGLAFRTNGNQTRAVIDDQGRMGIGVFTPSTRMDVNGGLTIRRPGNVNVVVGTSTVTVGDNSYMRVVSTGASTINLSNGLATGQMLLIESGGGTITVSDNAAVSNCNLAANRSLGTNDVLTLIWNGADWIEVSFTNN